MLRFAVRQRSEGTSLSFMPGNSSSYTPEATATIVMLFDSHLAWIPTDVGALVICLHDDGTFNRHRIPNLKYPTIESTNVAKILV